MLDQWEEYQEVLEALDLRAGDQVIGMDIVEENSYIFVISEKGYGKRTKVAQFTAHARGGVGIRSAVVNHKTGQLSWRSYLKEMMIYKKLLLSLVRVKLLDLDLKKFLK